MTAVARWTGGGETRKKALRKKLDDWREVCSCICFLESTLT
jgi:hypothetical protein